MGTAANGIIPHLAAAADLTYSRLMRVVQGLGETKPGNSLSFPLLRLAERDLPRLPVHQRQPRIAIYFG